MDKTNKMTELQVKDNTDDESEEAIIAYHAGWCAAATCRQLQHKPEANKQALSILAALGSDVQIHPSQVLSKLSLVAGTRQTSTDDITVRVSSGTARCRGQSMALSADCSLLHSLPFCNT